MPPFARKMSGCWHSQIKNFEMGLVHTQSGCTILKEYSCRRSNGVQIPVFGEWDKANEMPITQYFESARQAGLIRDSCHSSQEQNPHLYFQQPHFSAFPHTKCLGLGVLVMFVVSRSSVFPEDLGGFPTKGAIAKKRCPEQKWTGKVEKVRNESGPQRQTMKSAQRPTNAKPVDEDLYKIPPHLLPGYKRVSGNSYPEARTDFKTSLEENVWFLLKMPCSALQGIGAILLKMLCSDLQGIGATAQGH
ncbi:hypothetical protein FXO37_17662 [Capsicum annuum]|nr:hypothetical protein FXO37_17662 [Capsicum annuum]